MRTISLLIALVFALSIFAAGQAEVPKAEMYLGYSYMRIAPPGQVNAFNSNGGLGQLQFNINADLGLVIDLGGQANGNISVRGPELPQNQTQFSYLFGPRWMINKNGKYMPFVEFELGGIHNSRSFNVPNTLLPAGFVPPSGITVESAGPGVTKIRSTQNAFAMAVGGGFEIKVNKRLAVRPFELDYVPAKFSPFNFSTTVLAPNVNNNTRWSHNIRYTGGVTFRFGGVAE